VTGNGTGGRLAGRRVIITGASSGVGLVAARLFAREGATLALLARSRPGLEAAARAAAEEGAEARIFSVDLADREAAEPAVEDAVAALGGVDVLVANSAAMVFGHFSEVEARDFERTIAATFLAPVNVIRAALPHLRAARGTIVATGSLNSRIPLPAFSSYSAAKHALRGLLNTLRVEEIEQRSGVQVAMVHPGPIDTPVFERATSATGFRPRRPPDAYRAEAVAQALVETALDPRPEAWVGGETRAVDVLFGTLRPVAELVLLGVDRWYRSCDEENAQAGSLWEPVARPRVSGGIPARESLTAWLRFGRPLRPTRRAPAALAANLAGTAARGARLLPKLVGGPVPERGARR
jgi:NAD(P)-dependent dehydrogenase (short-subunit alcohol dehydrogenase family)